MRETKNVTPVGKGLRGPDKQQDERRVQNTGRRNEGTRDDETAQQASVIAPVDPSDPETPAGLYRERKDPINPTTGRKPR